jgi:hypothetical protein
MDDIAALLIPGKNGKARKPKFPRRGCTGLA